RSAPSSGDSSKPRKKAPQEFKLSWLEEFAQTETVDSKVPVVVKVGSVFSYTETNGVICKVCTEAKAECDFTRGKIWDDWKLDYLKRHLLQKVHLEAISKLRLITARRGINVLLTESSSERETRI